MSIREGRFEKGLDPAILALSQSIGFDRELWREDIAGSLAHARMLFEVGILAGEEWESIRRGLEEIGREFETGQFPFDAAAEDIHMNIEKRLAEKIGLAAGKLHTGRSRNDQVATDLRLYLKRAGSDVGSRVLALADLFVVKAERHRDQMFVAYTHLQRAQPVLFSHHLLAYVEMLLRDLGRLEDLLARADECPLGSGAATGTGVGVDRDKVARSLGFARVTGNSLDAVSDRDFLLEFHAFGAILAVHLSRLAEEIVLWSTVEFGFLRLSDSIATGSSMMPQKKNPDGAELVRGKTGRVIGHLVGLLSVVKGLPLSYNRDLQEDKEGLFDTVRTLGLSLDAMRATVQGLELDSDRMAAAARDPASAVLATDLAEAMARSGVPFREAHRQVGALVRKALELSTPLECLPEAVVRDLAPDALLALAALAGPLDAVARKDVPGGTSPAQVEHAIVRARERLEAARRRLSAPGAESDQLYERDPK